jgi:uncharacterized membrane protein
MKWLCAYIVAALAFGGLDAIWLRLTSTTLYRPRIGALLAAQVQVAPAVLFYLIYIAGIVYFPVRAAYATNVWRDALAPAAMMALVAYSTYDLTNQATMRVWSVTITIADIAWGIFATTAAAVAAFLISHRIAGA